MTKYLSFAALVGFAFTCHGAEQRALAGTASPDKQVVIVEETTDAGRDYFFVRRSDRKKLGYVLPSDVRYQISSVAITASRNARGTCVALLVFYGTKLSTLLLFTKEAGRLLPVAWHQPDAEVIYRQRTGRTVPRPGDGYAENAVGPWLEGNTVRLVSGHAMQTEDTDHYTHLLIVFKTRIQGKHATVSELQIEGPFSDQADERFTERWGSRYFSDTSE